MDDYEKLIRAAADGWDPGHTQPFEDMIADANIGLHLGDTDEAKARYREMEYARGQVEMIHNLGWSPRVYNGEPKYNIARDIMAELDAREMMGPAKRVAAVIELMGESAQSVGLDDILLWMHLEHHEEVLRQPILETFAALRAQNFDFHDQDSGRFNQHYWDTTDDYVRDALQKYDLIRTEVEHVVATFHPEAWSGDSAVPVDPEGDTEWDVDPDFLAENDGYVQSLIRRTRAGGEDDLLDDVLDNDDVFKNDPAAPEWVRNWQGPFSIHLDIAEV